MFVELVERMVRAVAWNPDEVKVTEGWSENTLIIELSTAKEDQGRVIGKYGDTVRAMRTLLQAAAHHSSKRIRLEVVDRQGLGTDCGGA